MSLQYRVTLNRENMNAAFMSKTEDNNIIGAIYTPSNIRGGSLTSAGNLDVSLNAVISGTLNVTGASSFTGTVGLSNTLTISNSTTAEIKLTGGNTTLNLNRLSTAFDNDISFSTGGTNYWKIWQDNNQNLMVKDISTGKNLLTFEDETGMIGVGTTNPSWQLTVSNPTGGDSTYTGGILVENTSATSGEAAIGFKNISTGSNFWAIGVNQSDRLDIAYGTTYGNANTFMSIGSTGNVGIATYAPTYKLDVNGTTRISGAATLLSTLEVTDATTLLSTLGVTGAATLSSTLDVTGAITGSSSLSLKGVISFDDVSRYWLSTATNWGVYWNTTTNALEFHGSGTSKANIDLDTGIITAPTFDGNATTATSAGNADTVDNYHLDQDVRTTGNPTFASITISGNSNITGMLGVTGVATFNSPTVFKGDAASKPIMARGIVGSDGAEAIGPLYLQYGANNAVMFGNTGAYNISADGSVYSGTATNATNAGNADTVDGLHASSFASSGHGHTSLAVPDTRDVVDNPAGIPNNAMSVAFKSNVAAGNPPISNGSTFAHILNMNGWNAGNSGGGGHNTQLAFGDGLAIRMSASTTTWGAWKKIWKQGDSITSAVWNDLAEYMECNKDTYSPGDVIAVDDNGKLYKTNKYNQSNVVGVYSDTFGFSLGGEYLENEEKLPIGISGRVNVKVVYKEDIKVGDLLVSSEKPGYAVKASSNKANHIGCIIGKVTSLKPIKIIENDEQKNTITDDMVTMIIMLA